MGLMGFLFFWFGGAPLLVLSFMFFSRKLAELAVVTLAESKYRLGVAVWQGQGGSRPNA